MNHILFLCTGNYYRSRFAEEYFNYLCRKRKLNWKADSRGIAREITRLRNPGPMSKFAKFMLFWMGVKTLNAKRFPVKLEESEIGNYKRIIAMSRIEHEPMILEFFPKFSAKIEYFEIGDTHIEKPELALKRLKEYIRNLVNELEEK